MPATKKMRRGRRPAKGRRRMTKAAVPRTLATRTYSFVRTAEPFILNGAAGATLGAATFALSALTNVTDFTNLFDQYQITRVKLFWNLRQDPSVQALAASVRPRLYWYNDFNDSTVPASYAALREVSRVRNRILSPDKPVVTSCKPAILNELVRTAGVTTNSPMWRVWLPTTANDVQHYAQKYGIENFGVSWNIELIIKYYFKCKQAQ